MVAKGYSMRIAMISEHASPLADPGSVDSGGQNVYVAQVSRHLARMGHQVDVFTRRDDDSLPEILEWEDGVRVVHVPAGPPKKVPKEELLSYMPAFSRFVVGFIQQQATPYDLLHAHFWMSAIVAADVKRALNIPFVVTFHALGKVRRIHQGDADGFPDLRFEIEEKIMQEADRVIAEAPQDIEDMANLYGADPERLALIPCGFDPEELKPQEKTKARKRVGIPSDKPVILQLGRMVPRKGVANVIRALGRLERDHQMQARLMIVGGASEEPDPELTPEIGRLQKIAEQEGVADRVQFVGRRCRQVLQDYYSSADVFVSTPWYEPFGITPVEAMACGVPVIGANVGGIKYTVVDGETGYLVPPKDPEALAERLAYVFANPEELKWMGQQAIRRANQEFTWKKVSISIAGLYLAVLDGRKRRELDLQAVEFRFNGNGRRNGKRPSRQPHPVLMSEALNIPDAIAGNGKPTSTGAGGVFEAGFDEAIRVLRASKATLKDAVLEAADTILTSFLQGGKMMVAGNGGSAADAQHFASELVGRFIHPDRRGLPVIALTTDSAFLTAWSNDVGYDKVFSRQIEALGKPGDVLFGISTSGLSSNLVEAFKQARRMGIVCIALLGQDGGDLRPYADLTIQVPSRETARIQEVQILVIHLISQLIESQVVDQKYLYTKAIKQPKRENVHALQW